MKVKLISTAPTPSDQGIRGLSSLLKKEGHEVKLIFMCYGENYRKNYKRKELEQLKNLCSDADFIGINAFSSTFQRAVKIIKFLKILKKPIIFGGIHATLCPEECIKHCNVICVGEGEGAIVDFANSIKNNKPIDSIKNLWIKKENEIIKNPVRDIIDKLDILPPPDYEIENHYILEKGKIKKFEKKDLKGSVSFLTGRGCPYGCTYCSNNGYNILYKGKCKSILRWHSVDYIISQVKHLKEKFPEEFEYFDIRDDSFFMRPLEQIKEFSEKYKEIGLRFRCISDPKTMSDEKLKLLADAGCTDISLGIQSCEDTNKEIYHRYVSDEEVLRATKVINKYKDQLSAAYEILVCNPYESSENLLKLIRLIMKFSKPYRLAVSNLIFFKGTELYARAAKDKIIRSENDAAIYLGYTDRSKHLLLRKNNLYLNIIINLMRGVRINNKYGSLKESTLNFLIKDNLVKWNLKHPTPSILFVYLLGVHDFLKYKILRPIYLSLPLSLRQFYARKKYEGKIYFTKERI